MWAWSLTPHLCGSPWHVPKLGFIDHYLNATWESIWFPCSPHLWFWNNSWKNKNKASHPNLHTRYIERTRLGSETYRNTYILSVGFFSPKSSLEWHSYWPVFSVQHLVAKGLSKAVPPTSPACSVEIKWSDPGYLSWLPYAVHQGTQHYWRKRPSSTLCCVGEDVEAWREKWHSQGHKPG